MSNNPEKEREDIAHPSEVAPDPLADNCDGTLRERVARAMWNTMPQAVIREDWDDISDEYQNEVLRESAAAIKAMEEHKSEKMQPYVEMVDRAVKNLGTALEDK